MDTNENTIQRQEALGELMRKVSDVNYRLHVALFKFQAIASYFDEIPDERVAEVESAVAEGEDVLISIRAVMATFIYTGASQELPEEITKGKS